MYSENYIVGPEYTKLNGNQHYKLIKCKDESNNNSPIESKLRLRVIEL